MTIWAIADLHLSFGVPKKTMEVFGEDWVNHTEKLKSNWVDLVKPDDLVLIAGDISWATSLAEAKVDLDWIDALKGTKVMIKGNHDSWWSSLSKVQSILPPSIHLIQNNVFDWAEYSIGGARLWDTEEYRFDSYINFRENPVLLSKEKKINQEKIFERELVRLELSLKALNPRALKRLVMTHYPPISTELLPSRSTALLEKYHVDVCVFGHLHSLKRELPLFGLYNGIEYHLTSSDYLSYKPLLISQ
ncbi:MAG: metallophosphoesterase [Chlamydiales bacterium]